MKKTLLITSLLGGATNLMAQGLINLQSYAPYSPNGGYSITIYSEDYANPGGAEIEGNNNIYDHPAGNTVYANESPLGGTTNGKGPGPTGEYNGNNYTIGFYFATSASALQTAVSSGVPGYSTLLDTRFGAGDSGTYDPSGAPIVYSIPGVPAGTPTYVAIAAWYSADGAGSYSAAVAANVPHGDVFATNTFTPSSSPTIPPDLSGLGLTSFNLVVSVPEPDIIELGTIAGGGILIYRRKRIS